MMRGPILSSMATRMPDGSIDVETWNTYKDKKIHWTRKAPFIRGIFNMVDSMVVGYGCLMKSAEKAGVEDEEPSKFDRWLEQKLGDNMMKVLGTVAVVLGVGLAAVLFVPGLQRVFMAADMSVEQICLIVGLSFAPTALIQMGKMLKH